MNMYRNVLHTVFVSIFLSNIFLATTSLASTKKKPNILFFLTDDWGFNDVGYYGNTDTMTPFIDSLVSTESLRIDKHYVLPECTVTRCALLTGRYPMRYGMQDGILQYESDYALSRHETLLSNEFQSQGYKTHLIGKWHVGMRNYDYTPTYRGFDSFFGFYGGLIGYYDHFGQNKYYENAIDFRWNEQEYNQNNENNNNNDIYTLDAYTDRILSIIDETAAKDQKLSNKLIHNTEDSSEPFFMYVGWQGSHSPSEAPEEYAKMYEESNNKRIRKTMDTSDTNTNINIKTNTKKTRHSEYRQYFQAQTTYTDDLFEDIVNKLKETGLWDNTLIVFASDNGGTADYGDNSPLRGGKFTIWEGGVRVPAFITGGLLPQHLRGTVLDQFAMHITDWYQTLLNFANLEVTSANPLDGQNLWQLITNSNKLTISKQDAIVTTDDNNAHSAHSAQSTNNANNVVTSEEISDLKANLIDNRYILINVDSFECENEVCGALMYGGRWKLLISSNQLRHPEVRRGAFWMRHFAKTKNSDVLQCGEVPQGVTTEIIDGKGVLCEKEVCLFDLANDPCEYYDVSETYPEIREKLYGKLKEYYDEQVTPLHGIFEDVDESVIDPTDTGFWHPWDDARWYEVPFERYLDEYYSDDAKITKDNVGNVNNVNNINNEMHRKMDGMWHDKYRNGQNRVQLRSEDLMKSRGMIFLLAFSLISLCITLICISYVNPKAKYYRIVNYDIYDSSDACNTVELSSLVKKNDASYETI